MFADDTNIFFSHNSANEVHDTVNAELKKYQYGLKLINIPWLLLKQIMLYLKVRKTCWWYWNNDRQCKNRTCEMYKAFRCNYSLKPHVERMHNRSRTKSRTKILAYYTKQKIPKNYLSHTYLWFYLICTLLCKHRGTYFYIEVD